jgi:hypothetical protein
MRYCLSCRRFSADAPLCTQCGRSFGGRLCNSKKRHLNPPDAQFCGQCGTTDLAEAASYVPFGCGGRLAFLVIFVLLLWWGGDYLMGWGQQGFTSLTGFRSPLVWLIEKSANVLVILFVFYFLSMFMPGTAGDQFRRLMSRLCVESLRFGFQIIGGVLKVVGKGLARLLEGEKTKR